MERDANKFRLVTFSIINKNFNAFSFLFSYFFQIVIFCLSDCIGIEIINRANYRLYRFKLTNNGRGWQQQVSPTEQKEKALYKKEPRLFKFLPDSDCPRGNFLSEYGPGRIGGQNQPFHHSLVQP